MQGLHDGSIKEDGFVDPELMNWTAIQLTSAIMPNTGEQTDRESDDLQEWMQRNVHVFSGFKTYQTLRDASDQLLDEDGAVRPFEQFRDRVTAIDDTYNVRYLRSEYEHAVASAQMAQTWRDATAGEADFPYGQYDTAGDDRVRPVHAALDGVRKKLSDPFWSTWWPPNGWRCRCDVSMHEDAEGGRNVNTDELPPIDGMFANNVGKNGVVFPKGHPYYSAPPKVAKQVNAAVEKKLGKARPAKKTKGSQPLGTPVSAAVDIQMGGARKKVITGSLALIDSVHGDGALKMIPIDGKVSGTNHGGFEHNRLLGTASRIGVKMSSKHAPASVIHEVGHWLDLVGMGGGHFHSTNPGPEMKAVLDRLNLTNGVRHLRQSLDDGFVILENGDKVELPNSLYHYVGNYLLDPKEMWARAYSQYIATKTGSAEYQALISEWDDGTFGGGKLRQHWTAEDFKPVLKAIDVMFKKRGWLK